MDFTVFQPNLRTETKNFQNFRSSLLSLAVVLHSKKFTSMQKSYPGMPGRPSGRVGGEMRPWPAVRFGHSKCSTRRAGWVCLDPCLRYCTNSSELSCLSSCRTYLTSVSRYMSQADAWQTTSRPSGRSNMDRFQKDCGMGFRPSSFWKVSDNLNIFSTV